MRAEALGACGTARRLGPNECNPRDPASYERGIWAGGARASSTYGGSWSPSSMIGPPRVFPRCGDIGGAWAPMSRTSAVEWVELDFMSDAPATAVRVFETNCPGSSLAVVDVTRGERLLYAGAATTFSSACVLEVHLDAPRVIRRVRVYLANPAWAEIDTVGLLAAAPLPEAQRVRVAAASKSFSFAAMVMLIVGGIVALIVGVAVLIAVSSSSGQQVRPVAVRPPVVVQGSTARYLRPTVQTLTSANIVWSSTVTSFSSQYSTTRNNAASVAGAPDVYPRHVDTVGAWAPETTSGGHEWIVVQFAEPVVARTLLWCETFHPGVVVRIDDLSDVNAPVVLWEGTFTAPGNVAQVAVVMLAQPRRIQTVRIVLDTALVRGWNEIDAVGLGVAPLGE
jgi:hypothetical protein